MTTFNCHRCGKPASRPAGHVNRSRAAGLNLYCGRKCSGLGRRLGKSKAQLVAEKRAYDMEYRRLNRELLKVKKSAYHKATYDPAKAARERKKKMPRHIEYCRQPAYRAWKSGYDKKYRANKDFGPFAEAALILSDLQTEILTRSNHYDIAIAQGTLNKKQERRRVYERLANGS